MTDRRGTSAQQDQPAGPTSDGGAEQSLTVLWYRDDLRVADHQALTAARADGPVVALWIRELRDDDGLGPRPLGGAARWWTHRSLEVLREQLEDLGIPLVLAAGRAADVVPQVAQGLGATAVRWSRRYAPASRGLDARLKQRLGQDGLAVHSHPGSLLIEPWEVTTGAKKHYKVFTPFWKAANGLPVGRALPVPVPQTAPGGLDERIEGLVSDGVLRDLDSLGLLDGTGTGEGEFASADTPRWWQDTVAEHWTPGCAAATEQLVELGRAVDGYTDTHDLPADPHGTARVSPRLRHGELSPRQLLQAVAEETDLAEVDREAWVRQIFWREFCWNLTYHHDSVERVPMRPEFEQFPYESDDEALEAWRRSRTGVALVDAGMRQLWCTGWMHNRVRLVTGSFLVKNLLQPWWDGEQWFWDTLVDADEANNAVSWQWVAGSGADAAPYFRVFNPQTQRERFDPEDAYVRQWTTEQAPSEPIVDLKASRRRALDAYDVMKERIGR